MFYTKKGKFTEELSSSVLCFDLSKRLSRKTPEAGKKTEKYRKRNISLQRTEPTSAHSNSHTLTFSLNLSSSLSLFFPSHFPVLYLSFSFSLLFPPSPTNIHSAAYTSKQTAPHKQGSETNRGKKWGKYFFCTAKVSFGNNLPRIACTSHFR